MKNTHTTVPLKDKVVRCVFTMSKDKAHCCHTATYITSHSRVPRWNTASLPPLSQESVQHRCPLGVPQLWADWSVIQIPLEYRWEFEHDTHPATGVAAAAARVIGEYSLILINQTQAGEKIDSN